MYLAASVAVTVDQAVLASWQWWQATLNAAINFGHFMATASAAAAINNNHKVAKRATQRVCGGIS